MKRPHFFEIFALANLALIALIARDSIAIVGPPLKLLLAFSIGIGGQAIAGILFRCVVAWWRRDRSYFATIRSREWIVDTVRLVLFGAMVVVVYGWIKLVVPIYHPVLFDAQLWDIDKILFFGIAPSTFFLDLFGAPWFLSVIDWSYSNIFFASASIAYAWALSHPERRIRIAFANGNTVL